MVETSFTCHLLIGGSPSWSRDAGVSQGSDQELPEVVMVNVLHRRLAFMATE
jgi:hypothetical protein